jgi:hypothetical protein
LSADFLHVSERENTDAKTAGKERRDLLSVIEDALEQERVRLMLANSILGCVQAALDPEAVNIVPPIYYPEVLEQARQLINTRVRHLEYEEIRRLLHHRIGAMN